MKQSLSNPLLVARQAVAFCWLCLLTDGAAHAGAELDDGVYFQYGYSINLESNALSGQIEGITNRISGVNLFLRRHTNAPAQAKFVWPAIEYPPIFSLTEPINQKLSEFLANLGGTNTGTSDSCQASLRRLLEHPIQGTEGTNWQSAFRLLSAPAPDWDAMSPRDFRKQRALLSTCAAELTVSADLFSNQVSILLPAGVPGKAATGTNASAADQPTPSPLSRPVAPDVTTVLELWDSLLNTLAQSNGTAQPILSSNRADSLSRPITYANLLRSITICTNDLPNALARLINRTDELQGNVALRELTSGLRVSVSNALMKPIEYVSTLLVAKTTAGSRAKAIQTNLTADQNRLTEEYSKLAGVNSSVLTSGIMESNWLTLQRDMLDAAELRYIGARCDDEITKTLERCIDTVAQNSSNFMRQVEACVDLRFIRAVKSWEDKCKFRDLDLRMQPLLSNNPESSEDRNDQVNATLGSIATCIRRLSEDSGTISLTNCIVSKYTVPRNGVLPGEDPNLVVLNDSGLSNFLFFITGPVKPETRAIAFCNAIALRGRLSLTRSGVSNLLLIANSAIFENGNRGGSPRIDIESGCRLTIICHELRMARPETLAPVVTLHDNGSFLVFASRSKGAPASMRIAGPGEFTFLSFTEINESQAWHKLSSIHPSVEDLFVRHYEAVCGSILNYTGADCTRQQKEQAVLDASAMPRVLASSPDLQKRVTTIRTNIYELQRDNLSDRIVAIEDREMHRVYPVFFPRASTSTRAFACLLPDEIVVVDTENERRLGLAHDKTSNVFTFELKIRPIVSDFAKSRCPRLIQQRHLGDVSCTEHLGNDYALVVAATQDSNLLREADIINVDALSRDYSGNVLVVDGNNCINLTTKPLSSKARIEFGRIWFKNNPSMAPRMRFEVKLRHGSSQFDQIDGGSPSYDLPILLGRRLSNAENLIVTKSNDRPGEWTLRNIGQDCDLRVCCYMVDDDNSAQEMFLGSELLLHPGQTNVWSNSNGGSRKVECEALQQFPSSINVLNYFKVFNNPEKEFDLDFSNLVSARFPDINGQSGAGSPIDLEHSQISFLSKGISGNTWLEDPVYRTSSLRQFWENKAMHALWPSTRETLNEIELQLRSRDAAASAPPCILRFRAAELDKLTVLPDAWGNRIAEKLRAARAPSQ